MVDSTTIKTEKYINSTLFIGTLVVEFRLTNMKMNEEGLHLIFMFNISLNNVKIIGIKIKPFLLVFDI